MRLKKLLSRVFNSVDFFHIAIIVMGIAVVEYAIGIASTLASMWKEKIFIVNPDYVNSTPDVAYEWISKAMEPSLMYFETFFYMVFISKIFVIIGLYQYYLEWQVRKIMKTLPQVK